MTLLDRMRAAAPCPHSGLTQGGVCFDPVGYHEESDEYEYTTYPDCNGVDLTRWNELVLGLIEAAGESLAIHDHRKEKQGVKCAESVCLWDALRSALAAIQPDSPTQTEGDQR